MGGILMLIRQFIFDVFHAPYSNFVEHWSKLFDAIPGSRQIYNNQTGFGLGVFTLDNATAEFRTMMGVEETHAV